MSRRVADGARGDLKREWVSDLNRVDLVLSGDDSKDLFERLYADREEIEAELGEPLTWHNPENAKMCRVFTRWLVDLEDRDDYRASSPDWRSGYSASTRRAAIG